MINKTLLFDKIKLPFHNIREAIRTRGHKRDIIERKGDEATCEKGLSFGEAHKNFCAEKQKARQMPSF
ncbi:hypothetical protein J0676_13040 [Vibrio sp. Vb2880]|uniref:Uncharacterized protein n=1 Tax=Vibrio furnissii TaxID=29494 RepID=A0A0Q2RQ81_VIBFU|nr:MULTISPECIES: hypothetical protein [Vibrio]KQH86182.1 hypothetical protein AMR76_09100 [Vibrio furnissii]MBO0214430.1 hypothetical protein [Vibrio sp. Vb2880]MCG6227541.1 hypothetical protein [Vibrio furnissii]MCG6267774.1 hypothetical protein [Vibrio furnissii]QDC92166.1 hypothetical protein FIU11_05365 [Vibrio furnissii]